MQAEQASRMSRLQSLRPPPVSTFTPTLTPWVPGGAAPPPAHPAQAADGHRDVQQGGCDVNGGDQGRKGTASRGLFNRKPKAEGGGRGGGYISLG